MTRHTILKTAFAASLVGIANIFGAQTQAREPQSAEHYPMPFQRSDGVWGYVNRQHCWVISPSYEIAFEFNEGLARVSTLAGGDRFIDRYGALALSSKQIEQSTRTQDADFFWESFNEGLLRVSLPTQAGRKYGFFDKLGRLVVSPQFDDADPFSEGLAVVSIGERADKRKSGFIDRTGRFVINPRFDAAFSFREGLALVKSHGLYGFIGHSGRYAILPQFDIAHHFSEGLAAVKIGEKWGFIDKTGTLKIAAHFDGAYAFSDGRAAVKLSQKWGFIDSRGAVLIRPIFDEVGSFSEGLAAVQVGNDWGYIDPNGATEIEPQFSSAGNFSNGRATVSVGGGYGGVGGRMHQITRTGTVLLDPTCTSPNARPRKTTSIKSKRQ